MSTGASKAQQSGGPKSTQVLHGVTSLGAKNATIEHLTIRKAVEFEGGASLSGMVLQTMFSRIAALEDRVAELQNKVVTLEEAAAQEGGGAANLMDRVTALETFNATNWESVPIDTSASTASGGLLYAPDIPPQVVY